MTTLSIPSPSQADAALSDLHPLLARLVRDFDAARINPTTLDEFVASDDDHDASRELVLLFSGDPVRFPEALDVAVVLPELCSAMQQQRGKAPRIGVVERGTEDEVARRFGVTHWPSLVFLRGGRYVGVVSGMHDWTDYLNLVGNTLAKPAGRAPTVGIAVVSAGSIGVSACG